MRCAAATILAVITCVGTFRAALAASAPSSPPTTESATTRSATTTSATQPEPFTHHDYLKARLEFNRRTMSEPYKQVGKHDPKWDADADAFLDRMALRLSLGQSGDYIYTLPGAETVTTEQMLALGERVRAAGCDDPMFLYCYAAILYDAGRATEAAPLFEQSAAGLKASRYPVNRAAYAALRQYYAAPAGAAQDAAWATARDLVIATTSTWDFRGIDRRILYEHISSLAAGVPPERMLDLVEAVQERKGADPWLVNMLAGTHHVTAAWAARGSGFAGSVTDAGWEGFYNSLTKARDALMAAWKLHPDYPEAPAAMIAVAMGAGDRFGEKPRTWFERATQAQFDYEPAYERYRYALLPKWGGSVPALQRFASNCLASRRFDTRVPWEFGKTIEAIVAETNDPLIWMSDGLFARVHEMCEGYAQQLGPGPGSDYFRSYEAAVACQSARWPEARKAAESLGDRVAPGAVRRVGLIPRYAVSEAFAFTGDDADALVTAEQKAQTQQLEPAIAAYEAAADKAIADKSANGRAAHFLKSRLQQLKWQKQFETGEWVDVQPKDVELTGWEPVAGTWTIDKAGTLTGVADANGLLLTFAGTYLSPRFEIDGGMELPPPKSAAGRVSFGMSLNPSQPAAFSGWWLVRRLDKVDVYNNWNSRFHREIAIQDQNIVNMTQFDEHASAA